MHDTVGTIVRGDHTCQRMHLLWPSRLVFRVAVGLIHQSTGHVNEFCRGWLWRWFRSWVLSASKHSSHQSCPS